MKSSDPAKKTILFMAQIPPPVHGAALRNKSLLESPLINSNFALYPLPLKFIDNMADLGKFSLKKIFLMVKYAFDLTKILLMRKIDLVYFTMSPSGGSFYRDILFITIIRIFRKKRILHFRMKGIKKMAESRTGKRLVKYAFRGSEIICLSEHHMLDVEGLFYKKPFLVPNGIEVELGDVQPEVQDPGSTAPPVRILFLSNLSIKKGVLDFIEALKVIDQKGYSFSASLVGDEWDLSFKQLNTLINTYNLQSSVTLEGPKYGQEKLALLTNADVFVFPTHFELFPGVILEAMQFGKAIVSTVEGSIPEMIDNLVNGLLVEPGNVQKLADSISFLIDNPEKRKEMGMLAQKKFFENFTLEVFESRMNEVFEEVLQKD